VDSLQPNPSPNPDGRPVGVLGWSEPSPPRPRPPLRWRLHLGLFLATFLCTTLNGGLTNTPELSNLLQIGDLLLEGLLFSVPLMLILTCHEMGHYIACRRHGLDATLPFFIPFPLGIGTPVGSDSWFVYGADPVPHKRAGKLSPHQIDRLRRRPRRPQRGGYTGSTRRVIDTLIPLARKGQPVQFIGDGHPTYQRAARGLIRSKKTPPVQNLRPVPISTRTA